MLRVGLIAGLGIFIGAAPLVRAQAPQNPSQGAAPSSPPATPLANPAQESNRMFGVIPNYGTAMFPTPYVPLSPREKFVIASRDSFDRGTAGIAVAAGAVNQALNTNRAFGQGVQGFAEYASSSYADVVIRNFLAEGFFPTLLHEDPRYLRRGTGGKWRRLGYAIGRVLWTRDDCGYEQFNYSEIAGTATEVAISTAYIQSRRTAPRAAELLGAEIGVHAATNVLREFWPGIRSKFHLH
jgi:hypothetical protein